MSDQKSDDRDYRDDDRRDGRGHNYGRDYEDDHGRDDDHGDGNHTNGPAAKVTAITALSADTGVSPSDFITSAPLQTVSGTFSGALKAGESIQISADGGAHWTSVLVSGSSWSVSGVSLVPGSGTLITRTIDSQSHTLVGASHGYVLDTLVAAPSLTASFVDTGASASDGITSANKATLSGTAEAGAAVKVYDGATLLATVTADAHGAWTFNVKNLSDGAHAFSAQQTDIAGNASVRSAASTMTVDTTIAAPSLTASFTDSGVSASDGITNATAATLSGTAEAGATVKVYDGSKVIGTVTANASTGAWSLDATGLQDGTHNFTAKQTDLAGNTSKSSDASAMTVDTIVSAPTLIAAFVDTGVSHTDKITSATTADLSGKADKYALVQIYDGSTLLATVTADKKGVWSFTADNLPNGVHSFTATQSDVAGNQSSPSAASTMTVAALAPPPGVTLLNDTGVSNSDGITHDGTLKLSGVLAGASVAYSVNGGTTWATSFTAHEGANSVQVRQTDLAGNVSNATTLAFTLDSSAAAPSVTLNHDTGIVGDTITSDGTLALTGIESGAKVEYSTNGGAWTTNFTAQEGVNNVQVRQTDLAGNTSSPTTLGFTLDTTVAAPGVALAHDTGFNGDNITSDGTLQLSGIEAGATRWYSLNGGAWDTSFTPVAGSNTVLVRQVDAAGNTSDATSLSFTLVANPPAPPPGVLAQYNDTAAADVFNLATGVLVDPAPGTHTYSLVGGSVTATLGGFTAAGSYGTLVLNSTSGAYTYTPDNAAINALTAGEIKSDNFTLLVSNGSGGTPSTLTVNVVGANDTPVLSASLTAATYNDTSATDSFNPVSGTLTATDRDAGATHIFGLSGGTVAGTGAPLGYDLAKSDAHGTLYLNSTSGAYTFVPDSTAINAMAAGVNTSDVFTLSVSDGLGGTASKSLTINLHGANDASVISGVTGPLNYSVGDAPVAVAPLLTLGDVDSNNVTAATVTVSAGFRAGNDTLSYTIPSGSPITGSYDNQTGILQFSGAATLAQYQTVLDSILFSTTTAGGRVVSYTVFDNGVASLTVDTSSISLDVLTTTGFRAPGTNIHDFSGFAVHQAGDINGDGFADVIIGAPFADGGVGGGASYVIFGKATSFGEAVPLASLDGNNGFRISTHNTYDMTGSSVSSAGDINGDGYTDLIIGAPRAGADNSQAGASYVIFGHAGSFTANLDLSTTPLDGSNGFKISGAAAHDWSGYAVSTAGDLNGDGFADLLIGARYATRANGSYAGAAYIVFGHGSAAPFGTNGNLDLSSLNGSNGFKMSTPASATSVNSVSNAGDVNGDGFGDLIIGAKVHNAQSNTNTPVEYVVFGHAGATPFGTNGILDLGTLTGSNGFSISSSADASRGQHTVSTAGDVNGDGFADLIVGMPYATTTNGIESGAAYVIFGKAAGFTSNIDVSTLGPSTGFSITGAGAHDWAGYSVSAAGDVNGDGYGDLLVGSPHALGTHTSGESYVIFGQAPGLGHNIDLSNLSPSDGFKLSGVGPGDASGYAVSAAGDVNGDGFADVIVGAAYASPNGIQFAGESYVVFGSKFIVGSNTYVGSSALHLLTGTAANDHFIAGSASDTTMMGNGGVDSFSGGAGNDTMHLGAAGSSDSRFLTINGGSGYDTLALDGTGMQLNLTAAGVDGRIHGIERIDLGNHNNNLVLDIRDVVNMSDSSNQLFITGKSGSVSSLGQGWAHAPGGPIVDHGISYDSYTLNGAAYGQGMANLLIDHNLLLANAAHLS